MVRFAAVLPVLLCFHIGKIAGQVQVNSLDGAVARIQRYRVPNPRTFILDVGAIVIQTVQLPCHFIQPPLRHFLNIDGIVDSVLHNLAEHFQPFFKRLCSSIAVPVAQDERRNQAPNINVDHTITPNVIVPLQWAFSGISA